MPYLILLIFLCSNVSAADLSAAYEFVKSKEFEKAKEILSNAPASADKSFIEGFMRLRYQKDPTGEKFLVEAAEQGHFMACNFLTLAYSSPYVLSYDIDKAIKYARLGSQASFSPFTKQIFDVSQLAKVKSKLAQQASRSGLMIYQTLPFKGGGTHFPQYYFQQRGREGDFDSYHRLGDYIIQMKNEGNSSPLFYYQKAIDLGSRLALARLVNYQFQQRQGFMNPDRTEWLSNYKKLKQMKTPDVEKEFESEIENIIKETG